MRQVENSPLGFGTKARGLTLPAPEKTKPTQRGSRVGRWLEKLPYFFTLENFISGRPITLPSVDKPITWKENSSALILLNLEIPASIRKTKPSLEVCFR